MSNSANFLNHYYTETELTVPMKLYLYNYNENSNTSEEILSWEPVEEQWWITGFNPYTVGEADAKKQVMIASVDFSEFTINDNNLVFESLVDSLNSPRYARIRKYFVVDKENTTLWLCWHKEVLL